MSIPPALGWMIFRPGSSETNRRSNSRRCLRFSGPLVSRSNVDFLRLAISCSCALKSTKGRLGLPKTTDSPTGSGAHLLQGGPATKGARHESGGVGRRVFLLGFAFGYNGRKEAQWPDPSTFRPLFANSSMH